MSISGREDVPFFFYHGYVGECSPALPSPELVGEWSSHRTKDDQLRGIVLK